MADCSEALRAYRQYDEDGVMCIVSRQAVDEAADEIERLRAEVAENDGVIAVWRRRCQDAERELAELRERVEKAPEVIASSGQHMMPDYLIGKRVRLVRED